MKNYEQLIANQLTFDIDRAENGAEPLRVPFDPQGQTMDVAMRGQGGMRQILKSLKNMAAPRTADILDKMEQPKNLLTPQAMNDLEVMLRGETQAADELSGVAPTARSNLTGDVSQEFPFFDVKPVDPQKVLEAQQSGVIPTDKLTPQRSYNIERHHQGARAAINKTFEDMQSADEMAAVLDYIADQTGERASRTFEEIRKSVKTPADIFGELEGVFKGTQKGLLTDKQNYAARVLTASLFENMRSISKAINGGDNAAETLLTFQATMEQLNFMVQYVNNNARETGRALSSHRMIAQALKSGNLEEMSNLLQTMGGKNDILWQAKLVQTFEQQQAQGEPGAARRFLGYLGRKLRGVTQPALEYWRAQILTSPRTHIVNMAGTVLQNSWDNLLIRPTGALLGEGRKAINALMGKEVKDYMSMQEVLAANASTFMTLRDSFGMMVKAFQENEGRFSGRTKGTEENQVGSFENVSKFFFGDKAGKQVSNVALASYRFLGAEDELGKAIAYRQELSAQAVRTAKLEGLTDSAMWKRAEELINLPTENMHAKAMEFAKRTTFQDEINGPILSKFIKATKSAIHHTPELGFIIPFIDTPTNIARRIVEISPLSPFSSRIQAQWAAGGAQRDLANAKVLWSVGLAVAAWELYDAEILTGPGPEKYGVKDAKLKEGWQPNAIRLGNEFYSVDRLAPFGQALAAISAYRDQAKYSGSKEEFTEAFGSMVLIIADNLTEMPFMQGFNTLLEGSKGEYFKVRRAVGGLPAGFVPYSSMLADVKNLIDPIPRQVTQDKQAQSGFLDYMKQTAFTRLPGLSFNMRPARYWDGSVKLPQVGEVAYAMSPFKIGSPKYERDKANVELIVQQVAPEEPSPIVAFGGVEFSLAELDAGTGKIYDAFIQRVGKTRRDYVERVINSSEYESQKDDGPNSIRAKLLTRALDGAESVAFVEFVQNDLPNLLLEAETLSPIGEELLNKGTVELWVREILETYGARDDADKNFKKSVRLRGRARSLHPKDIKLNPLH